MNVDNDRTLKYVIPTKSMTNKTQITEAYGGESAGRIYLYNSSLDDTWSNRDIIVEVSGKYYYTRAENLVRNDTGGWRGLYIPNTNIDISEPTNIWIYKASYDPEKLLLGSVEFGEGACSRGKNSTSLGNYTATIGEETEAAGSLSFAGGLMAKASGNGAFSFGHGTYAQGNYSNATGVNTKATIQAATSMGTNTVAEGQSSLATGEKTQASGKNSVSMGLGTKATKNQSVSLGNYTKAEGENSVSLGTQTISSGNNSIAAGYYTRAKQNNQVVLGEWNEDNANAYVIVGNGAIGKRSNAFEVLKDGSFTYLYEGNKRNIVNTEKDIENLNENRDALNNVVFSIEPWTTSKTLSKLPDFVGMARIDKTKTTGVDKLILQSANLLDVLSLKEVNSSYKETGNIITEAVTSSGITFEVQNDGGIKISGRQEGGWPQFKFLPNIDFVAGRTYNFNTNNNEIQFRITYTQGGAQRSEANPLIAWTEDTKIDRFMIQTGKNEYNTTIYPIIAYYPSGEEWVPFKKQVLSINESTYFTLDSFDTVEIIKPENYTGATSLVFELLHSENVGNNAKVLNGANNNKANYSRSTAAGYQTATSGPNQFVVGQYNADDKDALFIVGNGKDNDHRANAFVVKKNGAFWAFPWSDKKWACLGDSTTVKNSVQTPDGKYYDYVKMATGIQPTIFGEEQSGYLKGNSSFYRLAGDINFSDYDVVTIFGGFNDLASADIGEVTDKLSINGTGTICGAINSTLDRILSSNPTIQICLVTPTPNGEPGEIEKQDENKVNYVNAIIEICHYRGIPCLDLFHNSNLHPELDAVVSKEERKIFTNENSDGSMDRINFGSAGHKLIAPRFKAMLDTLII